MNYLTHEAEALRKHLEQMLSRLDDNNVESFKIGITENVSSREQSSDYRGYKLFTIAFGCPNQIRSAEKAAINYFQESKVASKCENDSNAGGSGQVQNADHLYIAIKEKQTSLDNLVFYPISFDNVSDKSFD